MPINLPAPFPRCLWMEKRAQILWQSLQVMLVVLVVMSIYQLVKYQVHPQITLVHSNMVTVVFSTLIAGCASFWIFRRQNALNQKLRQEVDQRRRVEGQLRAIQQHLAKQVAERTVHLELANQRLASQVAERQAQQEALGEVNRDLEQRMRELGILIDICRRRPIPRDQKQILRDTVNIIPLAWEARHQAGARIDYDGRQFISAHWRPDQVAASLPVLVGPGRRCLLEISLAPTPEAGCGRPGDRLHQELLASVADFLSKALERKGAQREKARLETRLRQTQKMEALGNLAGGVAHDFNNFLSAIHGYAELALGQESLEAVGGDLARILSLCQRAKELTKQILTFSRLSPSPKTPTDLAQVTREALKMMEVSLPPRIKLETKLESSCWVMADPVQICQVVLNICTNAVHAMGKEGGRLEVGLAKSAPWARLVIRDTGRGMSPKTQERIFEPFFTTKVRSQGTGLGLAVVHGIVKDHQGEIKVESQLGQGACFTVSLALLDHTQRRAQAPASPQPGQGERLLLVDDDQAQAGVFASLLSGLGYEVDYLCDSRAAWERFRQDPGAIDLLVTDLRMPGLSGSDLAQSALELRPELPILVLSGFIDPIREQRLLAAGVRRMLSKPVTLSQLASTLREVLTSPRPRLDQSGPPAAATQLSQA